MAWMGGVLGGWVRLSPLGVALLLGCQAPCPERCGAVQRRCADSERPAICADQCTLMACVDCFRCLDEEQVCPSDVACEQRCLGCSRTAP